MHFLLQATLFFFAVVKLQLVCVLLHHVFFTCVFTRALQA